MELQTHKGLKQLVSSCDTVMADQASLQELWLGGKAGCFSAREQLKGVWSLVSGLWPLVSGLWSLASGLWSRVSGLWSLASGLWSLVFGLSLSLSLVAGRWSLGLQHAPCNTSAWSCKRTATDWYNFIL